MKRYWLVALPALALGACDSYRGPRATTPMSCVLTLDNGDKKQIVVVAAGGHDRGRTVLSDTLAAFALE